MAWTHMTPSGEDYWVLPTENYNTAALALAGIARGLVDTAGTWVIVEAYSSLASGNKRRIPDVPGNDMDCAFFIAGGDFGWQTGTIVAGDWIVLESTTGGQECQVFLQYVTTTSIGMILIPKADWTTVVGAGTSTPTFPPTAIGTTMGTNPGRVDFSVQNAAMDYSVWSDTGTLMFIAHNGTPAQTRFIEIGNGASSHPDNVYPSFIRNISNGPLGAYTAVTQYSALGMDGLTLKNCTTSSMANSTAILVNVSGSDGLNNKWQPLPIAAYASGTGAPFLTWSKRWIVNMDLGTAGTLASKRYAYWKTASGENGVCILWDDVTDVP